jgi:hypothetical protein
MSCSYLLLTCLLTDIDAQLLLEASSVHQGPRFKDATNQENDTIHLLTFTDVARGVDTIVDRTWVLFILFKSRLLATFAKALRCLTFLHPVRLLNISLAGCTDPPH